MQRSRATVDVDDVAKNRSCKSRSAKRRRRDLKRRRRPKTAPRPRERSFVLASGRLGDHGPEDDDCPYCQAQRELGIVNGQQISQDTYAAYRARVDTLIAEGAPAGQSLPIEELQRSAMWIDARLEAEGRPHGLDAMHAMSDEEFGEHIGRVLELRAEYDALN